MTKKLKMRSSVNLSTFSNLRPSIVPLNQLSIGDIFRYGFPNQRFSKSVREWKLKNLSHLWRGLKREVAARVARVGFFSGHVCLGIISPDGEWQDYGLVSMRLITAVAAQQVVANFRDLYNVKDFHFHAVGSGTSAESTADTALVSEHASLYSTPNVRPTGSQLVGSSAQIFRSVAQISLTNTVTISEWGLFSQASTSGGYLFDRAVITPQTIIVGNIIQSDYRFTIVSGS